MRRIAVSAIVLLWSAVVTAAEPPAKLKVEYDTFVQQAGLDKNPERHAQVAAWCLGKAWKEGAAEHDLLFKRHQFGVERKKLKPEAPAVEQKRLLDLAIRLKLEDEQREQKAAWLTVEIKERRAKLKEGDAAGLKTLLTWAEKESGGSGIDELAAEVIKADPANAQAHAILGHFKDGENWIDPWDAIVQRGGLKDVKVRYEIHKQLYAQRKEPLRNYPDYKLGIEREPAANMGKHMVYRAKIVGLGEGKGVQFIWAPQKYTPAKPWPLIVYLHGGGTGTFNDSMQGASNNLGVYPAHYPDADYIVLAPAARNHVKNSWNLKENMLDVVDGIIDACQRFNIDRKRIYLSGASMGGQGTARFSMVAPELFAAFSPHAGAYWNDFPAPDLTGKAFFVIHGAKDEKFRNDTLVVFLDKIRKANATVDYLNLPEAGHGIPHGDYTPKMFDFFKKNVNEFAPDLKLARKLIEKTVTEKPFP